MARHSAAMMRVQDGRRGMRDPLRQFPQFMRDETSTQDWSRIEAVMSPTIAAANGLRYRETPGRNDAREKIDGNQRHCASKSARRFRRASTLSRARCGNPGG